MCALAYVRPVMYEPTLRCFVYMTVFSIYWPAFALHVSMFVVESQLIHHNGLRQSGMV